MYNKINTEFLQTLIKFDFFFSHSTSDSSVFKSHLKTTKLQLFRSYKYATILSPDFLLKEFKQFIRLIQFFKKQNIKISLVHFKDLLFLDGFKLLCRHAGIQDKIFVQENIKKISTNLIRLCFFSFQKFSPAFYKTLYNSLNYISVEFLSYLKKNDFGSYSVLVTINNWKKLVFLFLIFNNIYTKKIYEKESSF